MADEMSPVTDETESLREQVRELQREKAALERAEYERQQAEEALQRSEDKNRRLVEGLGDVCFVFALNRRGDMTYASPSAEKILGHPPRQLLGPLQEHLTDRPENRDAGRAMRELFEGDRDEPVDLEFRHADGSSRILQVSAIPARDEQGNVLAAEALAVDVTDRRRAEKAVRESSERFHRLAGALRERYFFYERDTDGTMTSVSPSVEAILGHEPDAFLNRFDDLLTDSPVNGSLEESLRRILVGNDPQPYELELRAADGEPRLLEVCDLPRVDATGKIIAVDGLARDTTAERRLDGALEWQIEADAVAHRAADEVLAGADPAALRRFIDSLGTFLGADRAFLALEGEDGFQRTQTWRRDGVRPGKATSEALGLEEMRWLLPRLEARETVGLNRVEDLPASARAERDVLSASGASACLWAPLVRDGELRGVLVMEAEQERTWRDGEIRLAQRFADLAASATALHEAARDAAEARHELERLERRTEAEIQERLSEERESAEKRIREARELVDTEKARAEEKIRQAEERAAADKESAEARVRELAEELAELEASVDTRLEEARAEARKEAERTLADSSSELERIRGEAEREVAAARADADERVAEARKDAEARLTRSREAAEGELLRVRSDAEARIDRLREQLEGRLEETTGALASLQDDTDRELAKGQAEAERRVAEAETEAERRIAEAEADVERRVTEAEELADERVRAALEDAERRGREADERVAEAERRAREAEELLADADSRADERVRTAGEQAQKRLEQELQDARRRAEEAEARLRQVEREADDRIRSAERDAARRIRALEEENETRASTRLSEVEESLEARIRELEAEADERVARAEREASERIELTEREAADRIEEIEHAAADRMAELRAELEARIDEAREAERQARRDVEAARDEVAQARHTAEDADERVAGARGDTLARLADPVGLLRRVMAHPGDRSGAGLLERAGRLLAAARWVDLSVADLEPDRAADVPAASRLVSMDDLVQRTTDLARLWAADVDVEVAVDRDADVPASLEIDGDRLEAAVSRLVHHAIHEGADGGAVTVRFGGAPAGGDDLELRCVVTSNAFPGADSGDLPDELSACRRLARRLGGELVVEDDEDDGGVSMTLSCRARPSAGGPAGEEDEAALYGQLYGVRVLVIDDHPATREALARTLEGHDLRVETAGSGPGALAMLDDIAGDGEAEAFDVVLIDWDMPGMDGIETVSRMPRFPAGAEPTVFLMGNPSEEDEVRRRARLAGLAGHLVKPVTAAVLLQTIAETLAQPGPLADPTRPAWMEGPGTEQPPVDAVSDFPPSGAPEQEAPEAGADRSDLLEDIPGIDAELGVVAAGSEDAYREALVRFRHENFDAADELDRAVARGYMDAARALAHRIREEADEIEAGELRDAAVSLDTALGEADPAELHPLQRSFGRTLARLVDALAVLEPGPTPVPSMAAAVPDSSPEALRGTLERLHWALSEGQPRRCRPVIRDMERQAWPPRLQTEVDRLRELVLTYRLDEADRLVGSMLGELDPGGSGTSPPFDGE